jgi:hypothetical protein
MAILMVTYDLKQPGRDYSPVHRYLKQFTYCKDLESFWLLDTTRTTKEVRDSLQSLVDGNDKVFVARLYRDWGAYNFGCGSWLNEESRNW